VPAGCGCFVAVARNLRDIFTQSEAQVGSTVHPAVFDRLHALIDENLERLRERIDSRAARGMTRDTHGDLHLDHVYYFPERSAPDDLVIIDCIEFNERFRFIDPVADMAFAFMDFAFHGRRDLATAFATAYFAASGDDEGRQLLPLYAAYRASVRGSVQGLKLAEREVAAVDRPADLQKAKAYWLLALDELEQPERRPCLVLVGGLPGSGKSTLARGLAERAGFTILRSDVVRKELAGLPVASPTPPERYPRLYSPEANDRTYAECLRRAENLLWEGRRVLVDATFREERRRREFLNAALRWGVPGLLLVTHAAPETVRRRLEQRRGDASDADWSIHQQMASRWEEPGTDALRALRQIASDDTEEAVREQALCVLRDERLIV
jgi:predicted kinase